MPLPGKQFYRSLQSFLLFCSLFPAAMVFAEVENPGPGQETVVSVTEIQAGNPDESTVTYPALYFEQYEPVTALDMLNRIPGIDLALSGGRGNRRGLGAGSSSILIDGKRIAGKENSGRDVLGRIAASQVNYFEIIRGTSANLEVRTAGPIVNVVMKEGAGRSSMSAEINADFYHDDTVKPGGSLSFGGQSGEFNYLTSFVMEPRYYRETREEYSVNGDYSPNEAVSEDRTQEQTDYKLSGNFGYQFDDNNLLQFNAFFEENSPPRITDRITTDLATDPAQITIEREDKRADRNKWEIGANYQHSFDNGGRFNFIFVVNDGTDDYYYDRVELTSGSETKTLFVARDKRNRERIFRTSYTTSLTASQDIEVGVEGAQTLLDKAYRLGIQGGGTPSVRFGGLVPATDTRSSVEEIRYEPFLIHNWQISSVATLESTLVAETSEITQEGLDDGVPVGKQRDFQFLKPKLDYRYDLTPATQIRATVERSISQLDFSDFSASNDGDLDSNISAGNPNLEQEKSWRYEVNLEYRLPDDAGVLNSKVFYHDIEDVIDRVDVSVDPNTLLSAPGNIGDGKRYGAELDASIRLNALDMPDALLTMGAKVQDSEVIDPFLNEPRRLRGHGRGDISLGFRHDLPKWNLNYGFDYRYFIRGNDKRVDIDDVVTQERDPFTTLFVEKIAFGGVTFRLESMNVLDGERCWERTRYVGATADGILEEIEDYCYAGGRKVALKIKTTF